MRKALISFLSLCFILPLGASAAYATTPEIKTADTKEVTPASVIPVAQRVVVVPRRRRAVVVRRRHRRAYLGINGGLSYIFGSEKNLNDVARGGGMVEIISGWRFGRLLALEAAGMIAVHSNDVANQKDSLVLGFTGSAKFYFLPRRTRFQPYGLIGVGLYGASGIRRAASPNKPEGEGALGFGVNLGVGADIRLNRILALGVDITYRGALWGSDDGSYFQSLISASAGIRFGW